MKKKTYRSFTGARKYVSKLGIKSQSDWRVYLKSRKKPEDIPYSPHLIYKNKGWKGLGDFLGTRKVATRDVKYLPFKQARKFVHGLKLKDQNEWNDWWRKNKPSNIPSHADRTYKKDWVNIGDWLGTGFIHPKQRKYRSFTNARKFAQSLKLKSQKEWRQFAKSGKKPKDIPTEVEGAWIYKKEWTAWGDFLGTGYIAPKNRKYQSFEETKKFAQKLNLKSAAAWRKYCSDRKLPQSIPTAPNTVYKEWTTWGDFLDTGYIAHQVKTGTYLSMREAKPIYQRLAKEYGLKGIVDWNEFAKKNKKLLEKLKIPAKPERVYTKERVWRKMK